MITGAGAALLAVKMMEDNRRREEEEASRRCEQESSHGGGMNVASLEGATNVAMQKTETVSENTPMVVIREAEYLELQKRIDALSNEWKDDHAYLEAIALRVCGVKTLDELHPKDGFKGIMQLADLIVETLEKGNAAMAEALNGLYDLVISNADQNGRVCFAGNADAVRQARQALAANGEACGSKSEKSEPQTPLPSTSEPQVKSCETCKFHNDFSKMSPCHTCSREFYSTLNWQPKGGQA